jgi:hypothetical protein
MVEVDVRFRLQREQARAALDADAATGDGGGVEVQGGVAEQVQAGSAAAAVEIDTAPVAGVVQGYVRARQRQRAAAGEGHAAAITAAGFAVRDPDVAQGNVAVARDHQHARVIAAIDRGQRLRVVGCRAAGQGIALRRQTAAGNAIAPALQVKRLTGNRQVLVVVGAHDVDRRCTRGMQGSHPPIAAPMSAKLHALSLAVLLRPGSAEASEESLQGSRGQHQRRLAAARRPVPREDR